MNKYLKCFSFALLIIFWSAIFDGIIVFLNMNDLEHGFTINTDLLPVKSVSMAVVKIIGCFFILFIVYFQKRQIFNACLFLLSFKKRNINFLWKYFLFICLAFALITTLAWLSGLIHLKENYTWTYQWVLLFLLNAFAIAIHEEITYRGLIAVFFKRHFGQAGAILFSSIVFMLMHLAYFEILPLCTVFLIGILSALLTFRYRSLYPAIGLHAGWDFCYFIFNDFFQPIEIPVWGAPFEFYQIGLFLLLITITYKFRPLS